MTSVLPVLGGGLHSGRSVSFNDAVCIAAAGHYFGSISSDSTCESVEAADVVVVVGAVSTAL